MITHADVVAARDRIAPHLARTPLTLSPMLSERAGREVLLKRENQQATGSFKPRGALNKLLSMDASERARGVVAASAGNHALGLAYAARALRVESCDLFVQKNASPAKIGKLKAYPARVHLVGDTFEEAQQGALAHAARTGATFVSAYDDRDVLAGQGTVGLEIMEDAPDIETVVVPVGGGALLGGIALAVKHLSPKTRVVGVNPAASPSALLSLQQGRAIDPYDHEPTLAHGLAGGFGKAGFEVARLLVDEIVLVTEEEMAASVAALVDSDQLLAEPSGIAALAAVLHGKVRGVGRTVVVLSGGNIDSATLRTMLR